MSETIIIPTYRIENEKMIQDGYFITNANIPLYWVSIGALIPVYENGQYSDEYNKAKKLKG